MSNAQQVTKEAAISGAPDIADSRPILEVRDLSKCYRVYQQPEDRLKQFFFGKGRKFFKEFWGLHPISFSVQKGECIGFIGRNGSGKSTLLQMVAGTLTPTSGTIQCEGRIAALLELGAGFNPEFSGRENMYFSGRIMGLSDTEIRERESEIERFAGIGSFIEQPVKTYSSGMYVRLAFATAIHMNPNLFLVDEALSVGDAPFQDKCLKKVQQIRKEGVSILFVTHNLQSVRLFCNRAGWIHEGRLVAFGDTNEVVNQYEDFTRDQISAEGSLLSELEGPEEQSLQSSLLQKPTDHSGISNRAAIPAKLGETLLLDARLTPNNVLVFGGDLRLRIHYEVLEQNPGLVLGVAIFRNDDTYVCALNTLLDKVKIDNTTGKHTVDIHYPKSTLLPGSYHFLVKLFSDNGTAEWDSLSNCSPFRVVGEYVGEGIVLLNHTWEQIA
ncbi:MAG: ABC transporter ATP-binding protein [Bdellovibrionales bacterium]|nr:ABC transporter ATP-binding protein [Bdellovibrionales bacterium]